MISIECEEDKDFIVQDRGFPNGGFGEKLDVITGAKHNSLALYGLWKQTHGERRA